MITQKQYEIFLNKIVDELEGDWVLIGGSLLALLVRDFRSTTDIDICPVGEMNNEMRLNLMNIAQQSGLSIESINPAADFFLRQIPNWKNSITLFRQGKKGSLYRPSLELYWRLKLSRASANDISDCVEFYNWHIQNKQPIQKEVLGEIISSYNGLTNIDVLKKILN